MALYRRDAAPYDIENWAVNTPYSTASTATAWSPPPQAPASIQNYQATHSHTHTQPNVITSSLPPRPPKPIRVYPEYTPQPNPTEVHLNIPRAF
jgi:hypothetical protein